MGKVLVLGSINDDIVAEAVRHPSPGETVRGTSLSHYPGGKGANQAVAAARSGTETLMIGCTGADAAGRSLVSYLAGAGVNVAHVGEDGSAPTGTALIVVSGGENTIVVVAGANGSVDIRHLEGLEISQSDVVIAQFETPVATTIECFGRARAEHALTILNPAPADSVPIELLALTDVLVVNEHEFELVFDVPAESLVAKSHEALKIVTSNFNGIVIVTLGESGAIILTEDGRLTSVEGLRVDAVDSTGAGDCFVGYLAGSLAAGALIDEAVDLANRAAALSVTRPGAASSIPLRSELA